MKKCILVGISGGIAAYKSAQLVSNLKKKGYEVHVLMTKNATEFITPLTMETLSGNRVSIDTFDRNFQYEVEHISLAKKADCFVLAPASANVISKISHGLADDMLTTTFLACHCPKIICPAMNTGMLENVATQRNIAQCRQDGMLIIEADEGYLACGDIGKGRLADNTKIEEAIDHVLHPDTSLCGKKILISAGPTQEALDPVRYLTNHSSGKMGYALARQAVNKGAEVILVSGKTNLEKPRGVHFVPIISAHDLAEAVHEYFPQVDAYISSAAVADYTFNTIASQKLKKTDKELTLTLHKTEDVLAYCGAQKQAHQLLVGFAMETENVIENGTKKCLKKNCDFLVANDLNEQGAGFQTDTNRVTLIYPNKIEEVPLLSKDEVSQVILEKMTQLWEEKSC